MAVPRLALCALLLSLALPSAAAAGVTVSMPSEGRVLAADPTDTVNSVRIARSGGYVHVSDFGVSAQAPCEPTPETANSVRCPDAGVTAVEIRLGPADDTLDWSGATLRREAYGEGGDDELGDGAGGDLLDGGEGDDAIIIGGGDDEAIGGDGVDYVSYKWHDEFVTAALPESGTSTGNGADGEDDVLHADIEGLHGSWYASSDITGNDQPNTLSGGHVDGRGGNDDISADGGRIDGGAGDDFIRAENEYPEISLACGSGNDRLDADNSLDPAPTGCETIAPEIPAEPHLYTWTNVPRVDGAAHLSIPPLTGTAPTKTTVEWWRCSGGVCRVAATGDAIMRIFEAEDLGHWFRAKVTVQNSAGGDERESNGIGEVEEALPVTPPAEEVPPQPPAEWWYGPPPGYADYGDYADVLEQQLEPLETAMGTTLRALARRWRSKDPRALARRRSIGHRVAFPETGTLALAWTASRPGARAAARRRVVIARGRATGEKGAKRTVRVRPTKRGRVLLRRAKRLRVTLSATFVGGAATAAAPAEAKRAFVLRRR